MHLQTAPYRLRLALKEIYNPLSKGWDVRIRGRWQLGRRSRLEPMQKRAYSAKHDRDGIPRGNAKIANGPIEGINSRVRAEAKATATAHRAIASPSLTDR
jgi:Transposase